MISNLTRLASVAALAVSATVASIAQSAPTNHVLLVSIDGLHAIDLANYINANSGSTLAALASTGTVYTQASCPKPSDSFPGILALVTGGSPRSTGVWYDDSYDRSLFAPGVTNGAPGAEIVFDETIDRNPDHLDAGGGIDPSLLPINPATLLPVYPHDFLKVNTLFEVVRAAGGYTAWCDKHPAYDLLNGPSGKGIADLYTPEINSTNRFGLVGTSSSLTARDNDEFKVQALLHQIAGRDHANLEDRPIPTLFGMNFQSVSVAQKVTTDVSRDGIQNLGPGGYLDAAASPTASLGNALKYVDGALQRIVGGLSHQHLLDSTYIIITAKHGQGPIDPARWIAAGRPENGSVSLTGILTAGGVKVSQNTTDDISLIWLKDSSQTPRAVALLRANRTNAFIQDILFGEQLKLRYQDPATDSRTPDIIVVPQPGVIYTKSNLKHAEHGGFNEDDTHVALLVSNPRLKARVIPAPVQTTQVAPTVLQFLGLNPYSLQAVVQEQTPLLPGFEPLAALDYGTVNGQPVAVGSLFRVEAGVASFAVAGAAAQEVIIQRSLDLTNWTNFSTNVLTLGGSSVVTDATATGALRYYRSLPKP